MLSTSSNKTDSKTPFQHRRCFFKRTRKGKIIRLVQEKYLRSDVGCGYLFGRVITQHDLCKIVSEAPHKQILIIDTNIAFHQIDVLDHKCPATCLVIVLQTVLQELRNLNLSVFRRIEALLKDETRSYIFYPNELSETTAVLRNTNETVNDANDRAIRTSSLFFQGMVKGHGTVVMVSNDADNQKKAIDQGLNSLSMRGYILKYLHKYPELLDLLANDSSAATSSNRPKAIYRAHLSQSDISTGEY
jgi:exosome complex exonuclease DIS3/RRP44